MWILAIDRSSSMGQPFKGETSFAGRVKVTDATTKLSAARTALLEHLAGIHPSSRVVVIAFNTRAETIYDGPAQDREAIAARLASIEPGGGTDIAAALDAACAVTQAARGERSLRTLLVTDGESDQAPAEDAARRLSDQGASIDVILIDPTPESEALARAVNIDGVTTAVVNDQELADGVAQSTRAQAAEEAAVAEFLLRQEDEVARLATEKPPAERLAFTAAYTGDILAEQWHSLTVYLHLASLQARVDALVNRVAGSSVSSARSLKAVQREVELTLTPRGDGLEFNPPSITVQWFEDVQSVHFRYRAQRTGAARPVLARVDIAAGGLPIAHLGLAVHVHADSADLPASPTGTAASAGMYQKVFASYSSHDRWLVEACRAAYWGLGIELHIDKQVLRAGEKWHPALRVLIDKADLFQLFWSRNAAASKPVRDEVLYALEQGARPAGFIRPVVWESPAPDPMEEIRQYHFAPLDLEAMGVSVPQGMSRTAPQPRTASAAAIPVAVVPLHDGVAQQALQQIVADVQQAVHLLESTTGLRYYPVPTLVVDEHLVASVRSLHTIDSAARDDDAVRKILRLEKVLRELCLDFHRRCFRSPPEFKSAHDQKRHEWLRNSAEVFPALEEVVRPAWYVRGAEAAAALGSSASHGSLADAIDSIAALVIARSASLDGSSPLSSSQRMDKRHLDGALATSFLQAGGAFNDDVFGVALSGPPSAYLEVVRSARLWLRPRLDAWPRTSATRDRAPIAERDEILDVCSWLDHASETLLASQRTLFRPENNFRCDSRSMLESLDAPRWHRIADGLIEHGFATGPQAHRLGDVTRIFFAAIREGMGEIQWAERSTLTFGRDDWNGIVATSGDFNLAAEARTTPSLHGGESHTVEVTGHPAQFLALFDEASRQIVPLLSPPPIPSSREDAIARIATTYGIFTPGSARDTDVLLYRWTSDAGLPQALALPTQDKVLLCTNAITRVERDLVARGQSPSDARALVRAFQRSILVHEHFHAVLECGLADGSPMDADAKALMRAHARSLNEALAAWMQWHAVRDNPPAAARVRDYIDSGPYPAWPYAGARHVEARYAERGMDAVRTLIAQLRTAPQQAQRDFDASISAPAGHAG